MKKFILAFGVVFGLMLPLEHALGHGGGLNSDGCHNETATGGYHCHRETDDDVDWETVGAVAGGAVILWLLVEWMDDDEGAFASRLHLVPHFGETATGIVAEYSLNGSHKLGFRTETHSVDREDSYLGIGWRIAF